MAEAKILQLHPEDAPALLRTIRNVWMSAYINPGLLASSALEKRFPLSEETEKILATKLKRQHDPADITKPRYYGIFPEETFLAGYIKTGKPFAELNRRDGTETAKQKIKRHLTGQPPELQAYTLTEILEIGVWDDVQGQGYGKALMQAAVEGLPTEVATVAAFSRDETAGFFEQYDFKPTGQELYYPIHNDPNGIAVAGMHAAVYDLRVNLAA